MAIADQFQNWLEGLGKSWKDGLRGWLSRSLMESLQFFLEAIEPDSIEATREAVEKIKANPNTPPEVKAYLARFQGGGFNPLIIIGVVMVIAQLIQVVQTLWAPATKQMSYVEEGTAQTYRLDPFSVITAWRRAPDKWASLFDDLKDLGISETRIEALKFITEIIPNAADIVRFALREVYSPDIAQKYGQFQDIPTGAYEDATKAGLSKDMFDKYWAAHWMLPSAGDGIEMLHRGILTEGELKDLLKANDVMPYWRDKLIQLSWNVPTRVDVRRFWEMRTIDEARLREVYTALGYHGRDLDDYVLWTKIYTDFPDILARYKNGWISEADVKAELIAIGMSADRADKIMQEKVKKAAPERVAAEKSLTKAEIVKGVKQGVITQEEGVGLLQDMGYGSEEADYIMAINLEAATGSPHNLDEFKVLTQGYRNAAGMEGKPMTEEIKRLGLEIVRLSDAITTLQRSIAAERDKLTVPDGPPAAATPQIPELEATLHKTQSELARVRTDYNAKVTAWRNAPK